MTWTGGKDEDVAGSPVESHSQNLLKAQLRSIFPCFVDFVREKQLSTVFHSSPIIPTKVKGRALVALLFCFIRMVGFEGERY